MSDGTPTTTGHTYAAALCHMRLVCPLDRGVAAAAVTQGVPRR